MEDRFLSALKVIERQRSEEFSFEDTTSPRLFQLTNSMSDEYISDNDYLKLLELYYQKYAREGLNSNKMYCLLRMQQIQEAKNHSFRRKKFKKVLFQKEWDPSTKCFLMKKKSFLRQMRLREMIPLMGFASVIYAVLLSFFVWGMHFPFLNSFIFSVILWVGFLCYAYFFMTEITISDQMKKMNRKIDEALSAFEKKRACDSFKIFHKHKK